MKTVYENIFEEDLPGFLCIKTQFWDRGRPNVEAYVRRKSVFGEWIWLTSKVVQYVNNGDISAVIMEESIAENESLAIAVNRITRITAILMQAVDAAWISKSTQPTDSSVVNLSDNRSETLAGTVQEQNVRDLQTLLHARLSTPRLGDRDDINRTAEFLMQNAVKKKKIFDPMSMLESVREGVRLDLGMTRLTSEEVKVMVLILNGRMGSEHVIRLANLIISSALSLKYFTDAVSFQEKRKSSGQEGSIQELPEELMGLVAPVGAPSAPPPIAVVNLSYTYIGNSGIELLAEVLDKEGSTLKTLDVSFCAIDERGFVALARGLARRKKKRISSLQGVILSGNIMSPRAASEIGSALSPVNGSRVLRSSSSRKRTTGYDSDSDEDDDGDVDEDYVSPRKRSKLSKAEEQNEGTETKDEGKLRLLHVANASMKPEAVERLLAGLGRTSSVRELNLSSNNLGLKGVAQVVKVLEAKQRGPTGKQVPVMPKLDRLDMSNNELGDEGIAELTRAILKRKYHHLVDLKLSSNQIGPSGIETIMNKLFQQNLISLSLDKNVIYDQGCQLVAASLPSMKSLSRINLGFNQIGSRGIASLMRSIATCNSMTYVGLSGNILKASGAIALAFTLSQHPRIEELDLDNCCLGQAAQCHIVAGVVSNRWVPMKRLSGFAVGPPMAAIGALQPESANVSNAECFRIRKDEQMKNLLQWMEANKRAKNGEGSAQQVIDIDREAPRFLSADYVSEMNALRGAPSQDAYLRMLDWLNSIPFDDDELATLQKFFYEVDGGDGDRGSDGHINLKLRGDLLAALDKKAADEMRDEVKMDAVLASCKSIGLDLDQLHRSNSWNAWAALKGLIADEPSSTAEINCSSDSNELPHDSSSDKQEEDVAEAELSHSEADMNESSSTTSMERKLNKAKARITLFPFFEEKLTALKATATELIEQEDDPMQHEIILTQYAEASLKILRQLRYLCMSKGLDGWPQSGNSRKILVVDDSVVTRKQVARAFEKANFTVDVACDGEEGVALLKSSIYDIAFMDIDMPVMNGFEATKKLREWEDEVRPGVRQPICALTATYVDDFERSQLMKFKEAGLDVMESKPCNIPRLFKVVDDVAPMFSDLSITVMQKERSEQSLLSGSESSSVSLRT